MAALWRPPTLAERTAVAHPGSAIVGLMALPSPLMPLVASLVGNDFVSQAALGLFHSRLLAGSGHNASGAPLIEAVAAYVRTKCAAAHWAGPRPTTPLLWSALDFGESISTEEREAVEASLAQYETGDFPPPPTCGGASAEMLARFRRGQLEPTVFAVASGRGVYRGDPSLDPNPEP